MRDCVEIESTRCNTGNRLKLPVAVCSEAWGGGGGGGGEEERGGLGLVIDPLVHSGRGVQGGGGMLAVRIEAPENAGIKDA